MPKVDAGKLKKVSDIFHMIVGYCIAEWASVDESLFNVFQRCVGPIEQSAIIYYRSPGLDTRFSLTDELVKSILPRTKSGKGKHDDVKIWESSIKGYQDLLHVRRRVAHHQVDTQDIFETIILSSGIVIVNPRKSKKIMKIDANDNEKMRRKDENIEPLRIEDLHAHRDNVAKLKEKIQYFLYNTLDKYFDD